MRTLVVSVLGMLLCMATAPVFGQQMEPNVNDFLGVDSLFADIPLKDISSFSQNILGEKKEEPFEKEENDKIIFDSPLEKILAIQKEQNGEEDENEEDRAMQLIDKMNNGGGKSLEDSIMAIISANENNNNEVDVDAEAINFMSNIANNLPASVENMIENIPLSDDDLREIQGYERVIEDMIGQEMKKEIEMNEMQEFPESFSEEEQSYEEYDKGVVDYGQGDGVFGGRRWGRRDRRFGGLGIFRQNFQQQREEETKKSKPEPAPSDGGKRRVLRRRKQQQDQQEERQQRQQQQTDEKERPRRIANTVGRARLGLRTTAGATRQNLQKAAEFTAENAMKTALGLGEVMVDVNGGVVETIGNMDFEPINEAATKTAGYLVGMAERNVPKEIMSDLLTTDEGNALETVRSVLLKSKNPEAMVPIVEQVGTNYVKVMKKLNTEMNGFLKLLFSTPDLPFAEEQL